MYPRIKKVVFWWKWWKTIFCILFLFSCFFWKDIVCAQKSVVFSIIFETVWILFSLHFKAQKNRQKPSFFVFLQFFFFVTFFFFQHFSHFLSHHCCLCSLFPFIFLFISICFSLLCLSPLFSILFFSLSQCFSFSPSVPHVSLSFFPSPFFVYLLLD